MLNISVKLKKTGTVERQGIVGLFIKIDENLCNVSYICSSKAHEAVQIYICSIEMRKVGLVPN